MLRAGMRSGQPSATFQWWCQVKGGAAGFICTSEAKAVLSFSRAGLARVNSCPSRAWWAFGSWSSAVHGLPQRLKPSFIFWGIYGTSELVPFPSLILGISVPLWERSRVEGGPVCFPSRFVPERNRLPHLSRFSEGGSRGCGRVWGLGAPSHHVFVAAWCARASLRDAVGVWCCAFPPVNWRAIFIRPFGTLGRSDEPGPVDSREPALSLSKGRLSPHWVEVPGRLKPAILGASFMQAWKACSTTLSRFTRR